MYGLSSDCFSQNLEMIVKLLFWPLNVCVIFTNTAKPKKEVTCLETPLFANTEGDQGVCRTFIIQNVYFLAICCHICLVLLKIYEVYLPICLKEPPSCTGKCPAE